MQEMIEPDRTILIVSVVGLIVIWGSVAYHKWVQDSAPAVPDPQDEALASEATSAPSPAVAPVPAPGSTRKRKNNKGR